MVFSLLKRVFPDQNTKTLRRLAPLVRRINDLEAQIKQLSDEQLSTQTELLRARLLAGTTLDDILPEAFAVVREVSRRVLGKRHFDVQLIGGIALHRGMIAQMRTGEGKTLVATLPVYLNALTGKGVHVVTINDYLAHRDAENTGQIFRFLGLTVGCVISSMDDEKKHEAYGADVTYGTNNEFGFDYLRDNLKYQQRGEIYVPGAMVQRPLHYAIVDEVDSIFIDEARTPLIISGKADNDINLYRTVNLVVKLIKSSDYEIDLKARNVTLTESGNENVENILREKGIIEAGSSLYDVGNMTVIHHLNQAMKAHHLFHRDREYVIRDRKVLIIDEFTGRIMDGRRYSDGLHQAIEAKEGVRIENENQTIASTTFQNYFRLYHKLSGMTGTAAAEAQEFEEIYGLKVLEIPTNQLTIRVDCDDIIYRTEAEKYRAIVKLITETHATGQPILVGTTSIESSERLSKLLKQDNIPHNILNAKYHEKEAQIIAQAGRFGAVTVATNMAGRGTDIMLGGNPEFILQERLNEDEAIKQRKRDADKRSKSKVTLNQGATSGLSPDLEADDESALLAKIVDQVEEERKRVVEVGGLMVIGTERHDARRIDDQLRGRSGRQGDPGKTVFYLSLEDKLMKMFGSERISNILMKLGMKEDEAIFHPLITKSLVRAQQKVESMNYDTRKNVLQYDDIANSQRQVIFQKRLDIINGGDELVEQLHDFNQDVADELLQQYLDNSRQEGIESAQETLLSGVNQIYGFKLDIEENSPLQGGGSDLTAGAAADNRISSRGVEMSDIEAMLLNEISQRFAAKLEESGEERCHLIKRIMLGNIDKLWKNHLYDLDQIRRGIHLRSYGQQNPLNEYKIEAFNLFKSMMRLFEYETLSVFMHMRHHSNEPVAGRTGISAAAHRSDGADRVGVGDRAEGARIGRNDPCPCGSGRRYKACHGAL